MATKLTGRTRHRILTRRFGAPVLVLQVEVAASQIKYLDGTHSNQVPHWRDARVEDLSELPK